MKNIFKFFGTILTVVLAAFSMTGCLAEDDLGTADVGLHVKVFFPTKVVKGQPMTINGGGFSNVTEIVFPGAEEGIVVTDFQIVNNGMIRVDAPAGISPEGGKILVRNEAGEQAESPLPLTLGNTEITGYTQFEGVVSGGSQMEIFGTDLEFVNMVEMLDEDGNPVFIDDNLFNRKGTDKIIFTVPKKVFNGTFQGKVYTIDGKEFLMPEYTYEPGADGGYWEKVEVTIWENPDPEGIGSVSWSGQYRFYGEGNADPKGECIAMIAAPHWDIIKNGTFYLKFAPAADAYQIRANTGWWSFDGDGVHDIHGGDERIIDNGDGTFSLAYTLSEEPLASGILGLIDEQHLLFTGSGYTPLKLYYIEETWVEGGSTEIVRTSIWKNDGSVGAAAWSGGSPYRFAPETNSTGEEVYAVPTDTWEKMKTTPFKVDIQPAADWFQVRILDAWWSVGNNDANDITPNYEGLVDNGDGTFTFVVDLAANPDLVAVLDAQHLLFAGDGFTILEMYWEEEVLVPGGGGAPTEVVLWEGEAIATGWANQPNILTDGGIELQEVGAQPGQTIYLYMEPIDPALHWYLELVEGHWNGTKYLLVCSVGADTQDKFIEHDLEANGGRAALEVTQEMLDTVCAAPQGWGGTFIANGDNLKITKVTIL